MAGPHNFKGLFEVYDCFKVGVLLGYMLGFGLGLGSEG